MSKNDSACGGRSLCGNKDFQQQFNLALQVAAHHYVNTNEDPPELTGEQETEHIGKKALEIMGESPNVMQCLGMQKQTQTKLSEILSKAAFPTEAVQIIEADFAERANIVELKKSNQFR